MSGFGFVVAASLVAFALCGSDSPFDYFMLARQWTGTFCSSHECPLVSIQGNALTIHGLWPNFNNGNYPTFCSPKSSLDNSVISDLVPLLNNNWPSQLDSNEKFWSHEWLKHGTCSLSVLPSAAIYFNTTLKLHQKYDLAAALCTRGITPSDQIKYSREVVEGAIVEMYRVSPILRCNAQGQLTEIWLCVSKDLALIECPTGTKAAFSGGGGAEREDEDNGNVNNKCGATVSIPLLPDRNRRDRDRDGNGEGGHKDRRNQIIVVVVLLVVLGCLIVGGLVMFSWRFNGRFAVEGVFKPKATSENTEFQLTSFLTASDPRSNDV